MRANDETVDKCAISTALVLFSSTEDFSLEAESMQSLYVNKVLFAANRALMVVWFVLSRESDVDCRKKCKPVKCVRGVPEWNEQSFVLK